MEDKEVLNHFVEMLKKYPFTTEETEAIKQAIGILSWTSLRKGALQAIKEKRLKKNNN